MLDRVDVVDDSTVKIVLKTPFGALINTLAHPALVISRPPPWKSMARTSPPQSRGHRRLQVQALAADTFEVEKNDNYWKPAGPRWRRDHPLRAGERQPLCHAAGR